MRGEALKLNMDLWPQCMGWLGYFRQLSIAIDDVSRVGIMRKERRCNALGLVRRWRSQASDRYRESQGRMLVRYHSFAAIW